MNLFGKILGSLPWLGQRRAVKQEIDEELRFHIEQRTSENIAAGMPPENAAREARKRFGNVQTVRDRIKQVFGVKVRLDNHDGLLRAGMSADVSFPNIPSAMAAAAN